MKMKTAEAETEGKKVELDIIREKKQEVGGNKKPSKTVKAVVQFENIGWKTELANRMNEFNVAGNIARVRRPDSEDFDTEVTFMGNTTNVGKMKKFLNERKWSSECTSVAVDFVENLPFLDCGPNISIVKTPSSDHRTLSSGSETKEFNLDNFEASMTMSVSSISSSSQGRNVDFATNLLKRDFWMRSDEAVCLMCGEGGVKGAHIYPLNQTRTKTYFDATGSHNRNDLRNGYLLCEECHAYHDDGLCGFDENWYVTIEDALLELPKYFQLNGILVTVSSVTSGNDAPFRELLKVQQEFIMERREKRHERFDASKGICQECNKTFKTLGGLDRHICYPIAKKKLNTPLAKRKLSGKDGPENPSIECKEEEEDEVLEDVEEEGKV